MFDVLLQFTRTHLNDALQQHPDIPSPMQQKVTDTAANTVVNALIEQVSQGNLKGITEMLSGKDSSADHPVVSELSQLVQSKLIENHQISAGQAQSLAATILPVVMNMFNQKVNHAQGNGIDVGGILQSVLQPGSSGGFLGGILNQFINNQDNQSPQDGLSSLLRNLMNN